MTTRKIMTLCLTTALYVPAARAASHYYFLPDNGAWEIAENWDQNNVPGDTTADTYAHVQGGRTAIITSSVSAINRFQLGAASEAGILNIEAGAYLYMNGGPDVGNGAGSTGFLNISGGTVKCGSAGQNEIKVGVDSDGSAITGTLMISGGTVESEFVVGSSGVSGAEADLMQISGDKASIFSNASSTYGSGFTLHSSGTLKFVFSSTGISCLTFRNTDATFDAAAEIVIDGSEYVCSTRMFTLIDSTVFNGSKPVITLQNFEEGTVCEWDAANGYLRISAVPHPSGFLFALISSTPFEITDEFIDYIKNAANSDLFGLRDNSRFYPYSPPDGRRIAYRQAVNDNARYIQGVSSAEADEQLRVSLESVVVQLREIISDITGRNFDELPQDSQEILLDFAWTEGVSALRNELIGAAVSLDWNLLLNPDVYSRNQADWPDSARNKAYYERWQN